MGPYTRLFVHCVWATRDRAPLIESDVEGLIHAAIAEKCRQLGCLTATVGGVEDHVHLVAEFPASVSVAKLVKDVKGVSSHLVNRESGKEYVFRWQGGYGAFTIGGKSVATVEAYVRNQKAHHSAGSVIRALERCGDVVASASDDE